MVDALAVEKIGGKTMSDEQAKLFAVSICASVKAYIAAHRAEFAEWQAGQEASEYE